MIRMPKKMQSSKYWENRFVLLKKSLLNEGADYYRELEKQYRIAQANIEKEITKWYNRFAANNDISLAEAKRLLSGRDLEEFHWTVEEYIKYGEENALNGQWIKQLENASAKVHVTRFESLQMQMQQQAEVLFGNQQDGLEKLLREVYSEGYYRSAFEMQKGFHVGYSIARLDPRRIEKVINMPWAADGSNFSKRIWKNRAQLVSELHTELTQMMIRGDGPDKAIARLSKRFDVSKSRAGNLVMTESAFFSSAAQRDCFRDLDVEQYEVLETLDSHTCSICADLDGKVFKMSEYEVGVTAPPFHSRCRGCMVPYFDDLTGERIARGRDGKTYTVPGDMKYKDWKKRSVKDDVNRGLSDLQDGGIIKTKKGFEPAQTIGEAQQYAGEKHGISADYSKYDLSAANAVNKELDRFHETFGPFEALREIGTFPKGYSTRWQGAYSPMDQALWLRNVSKKGALDRLGEIAKREFANSRWWSTPSPLHTIRHELGHAVHWGFVNRKTVDSEMRLQLIRELYEQIRREALQTKTGTAYYPQKLSKYGMTNVNEFIAESIAEYMNGKPRETAKKVVELLIGPLEV